MRWFSMRGNNLDEAQGLLKQYKMFLKALNFINDSNDKLDICSEMNKLELDILDLTNISYEQEVGKILIESTSFIKEERLKLQRLVDIITSRINYVNMALKRHKLSTGNELGPYRVKGEDKLDEYKNNIRIIDKYRENLKNRVTLVNDIKTLEVKISSAMDRIEANKKANRQLEKKMITLLSKVFEEYNCKDLLERRKEINLAYEELGYSLEKARENVRVAKLGNSTDIILECDNMLSSITLEYEKYKEKKYILELIDMYDTEAIDYSDLLEKRERINDILKNISNSDIYREINEELKKQYNTIKLEQQDIDTYDSLCEEKKRKSDTIEEIDRENNSEEFNSVLGEFLENEKRYREALYLEQQKKEYAERQKKMLRDKEIQEERNRRQKLIEEERNKDIEKRTKELLKEKQNPVIDSGKLKGTSNLIEKSDGNRGNLSDINSRIEKNKDFERRYSDTNLEMPDIKNDTYNKVIQDDDTFFSRRELEDLNSDKDGKKESSWF